jgi:hypothetical protein
MDIEDDLTEEMPVMTQETTEVVNEEKSKKRQPTQYNLFVKETMALLATTRPDLVGKERFKYVVFLWNEKKKQT